MIVGCLYDCKKNSSRSEGGKKTTVKKNALLAKLIKKGGTVEGIATHGAFIHAETFADYQHNIWLAFQCTTAGVYDSFVGVFFGTFFIQMQKTKNGAVVTVCFVLIKNRLSETERSEKTLQRIQSKIAFEIIVERKSITPKQWSEI